MTAAYYAPQGGLPGQHELLTDRAMFTEAYAVLPRGTMRDIVTSFLPHWDGMRMWILARPLSGFAETFSQSGPRAPWSSCATWRPGTGRPRSARYPRPTSCLATRGPRF